MKHGTATASRASGNLSSGNPTTQTIAIAGASGFVGQALLAQLEKSSSNLKVIALTRREVSSQIDDESSRLEWRRADLFSLKQAETAVAGADTGIWLIHSMQPQARLVQGSFADIDLLLADNFARACRSQGIKRIIYLGGIIPDAELSAHLKSRREVEGALASTGIPVTTIRAGLVVGPGGSSWNIMERLVRRLPIMVCPAWTTTRGQPVYIDDVTRAIAQVCEDRTFPNGSFDIGGSEQLTYIDMLRRVARILGRNRLFLNVPLFTVGLSRLWVSLVTQSPRELVQPLIQSLKHPMLVRPEADIAKFLAFTPRGFTEAVSATTSPSRAVEVSPTPRSATTTALSHRLRREPQSLVFSIQRLPAPPGHDAAWIALEYGRWLVKFLYPFMRVEQSPEGHLSFKLRIPWISDIELLMLSYSVDRSTTKRQLFYIDGGILAAGRGRSDTVRGRLEFRIVNNGSEVLASIIDFAPALPWWIYTLTQAKAHLWVMRNFGRHLKRLQERTSES